MVIFNGQNPGVIPHHRQNRRRERPGSRTRRTTTRKANTQDDFFESIVDAHDPTIYLPSDGYNKVSPVFRQNFDMSWQRWKAREADEKARVIRAEEEERERMRMFGGELNDDVSLCEPMLRVLVDLFGDIDYSYP